MKVFCALVFLALTAFCYASAAPNAKDNDGRLELFSGVALEKDATGEERLNVKFEPGELRDAARTFEEARGKVKKYSPLLAGLGVKVIAVLGILFGGLTLLVTKALVVAKLAFLVAASLGIQKLLRGGGLDSLSGKITQWQSQPPQWNSPTAAAAAAGNYPYAAARSAQDANDLAYKSQIPN